MRRFAKSLSRKAHAGSNPVSSASTPYASKVILKMVKLNTVLMDRKTKGRLGEAKVIAYLIEQGYELYLPFSNNSKYDVIAFKDGKLNRVSIKFTSVKRSSGTWDVEMRQIYRGNKVIKIDKFDNSTCDIVAVYIGPLDRVILVDSSYATGRGLLISKKILGEVA